MGIWHSAPSGIPPSTHGRDRARRCLFYNLYLIKPRDLVRIEWHGVWRTYRFVRSPTPHPQSKGNGYIKRFRGGEVIFFRCCWPRYTHDDWLTARAVLVRPKHKG